MQAVAARAGCSKESVYAWFGNRQGLFAALIRRQAEQVNDRVRAALERDEPAGEALTTIATNLLQLLTGEVSVAINRAAVSSPELAAVLLRHGRHTTGPIVEEYLARLAERGELAVDDPAATFRLFYGLVVQDSQIRALLGEPPPSPQALAAQARQAVANFLALCTAAHGRRSTANAASCSSPLDDSPFPPS